MTLPTATLLHELNAIKDYITAVQNVLASGRMPEMIGLEQRVGDLCEAIQKAPAESQQVCLPELKKLMDNINDCERDLRAFHATYMKPESAHD